MRLLRFFYLGHKMEFKDYYKILGVEPDASEADIKLSYRQLARQYHPDKNPAASASDKFKAAAEAYEVLKNKERRAEFDELRRYGGSQPDGFRPPPGWQSNARPSSARGDYSDFFNSMFGAQSSFQQPGRAQAKPIKGQDVELTLALFLEETVAEQTKTVEYELPASQAGRPVTQKHLRVKIAMGVADGERIRVRGQGAPGQQGGSAGDLYLTVQFAPHPVFAVQAADLLLSLPLSPWEAALGAKVVVPTLTGSITLTVPANTPAGKRFRIKGKGLTDKGQQGDLYATVSLVLPPETTKQTTKLWQQLAKAHSFDPRSHWPAP